MHSSRSPLVRRLAAQLAFLFGCVAIATATSGAQTASAQSLDGVPIWRLQVRTHTCNENNAGTDAKVSVQLNDWSERFYLENPREDRRRDQSDVYDVVSGGVWWGENIARLDLEVHGSDQWCVDRIEIIANSNVGGSGGLQSAETVFLSTTKRYAASSTHITIDWSSLRNGGRWNVTGVRAGIATRPTYIPSETMATILQGLLGHYVARDAESKWGGLNGSAYVELTSHPYTGTLFVGDTIDMDVDLERARVGQANVDVDAVLSLGCTGSGSSFDYGMRFLSASSTLGGGDIESKLENGPANALLAPLGDVLATMSAAAGDASCNDNGFNGRGDLFP